MPVTLLMTAKHNTLEMHSRGRMVTSWKSLSPLCLRQNVCTHAYPRGHAEKEYFAFDRPTIHPVWPSVFKGANEENVSDFSGIIFRR